MTRRMLGVAVFGAAALLVSVQDAAAIGKKNKGCPNPCATTCGPCASPYGVSYVDQVVTSYKAEWKTKKVEVECVEYKMVPEPYKYKVCVPVTTKQTVKVCEVVQVTEPYQYTVMEAVPVKDKIKVCEHVWTIKDEPYSWYECVPVHTKQKRVVCETVCVPTVVTHVVPCQTPVAYCAAPAGRTGLFGRLCGKSSHSCPAPCPAPCPTDCGTPCATQTVCTTVMKPTVVTKEIEVDVCTYTQVKKDGVRKVRVCTPVWTEKDVTVCKWVSVPKQGARVVCKPTWVDKVIDVCSTTWVDKDGVREVCKPFPTKKWVDHSWCEMVKCDTVVKVPVMTLCATPCGMTGGCGGCSTPACCH